VYDAATVRAAYRDHRAAFRGLGPVRVSYAMKACPLLAVAGLLARAGADASVASLGELLAARRAGFPASRLQLHGNAKTDDELRGALRARVGRIVIDGAEEVDRLAACIARGRTVDVWLRVSPGIDVDTHAHLRTGTLDSKFGAPVATGEALEQARRIVRTPGLRLAGLHAHLGTQLHEAQRYGELARVLAALAREVRRATGVSVREIGVGGGLGIRLRAEDRVLDARRYAEAVTAPIRKDESLARATVYCEPGRALVGRAGVALYRVVATKRVPGVRTFVSVDGGMGDNIRPALYDARYDAVVAERAGATFGENVAIAGKYCESGDILIREVRLPDPVPGEVIAIPAAGAYALAMASNYNHQPRPAVILIDGGRVRLIRRRETHADIWRLERR
jgi:diaminopimelate decarboxylase